MIYIFCKKFAVSHDFLYLRYSSWFIPFLHFFFENKNLYTSHPSRDSRKVWYMNHIKTSWKCSISKTCFANFFARFTRMKKKPNQLFSSVWRNQSYYLLYVFLNIVFIRNYIVNIYYLKFYASQRLSNVEKQRDTYLSFLHLSSLALLEY